MATLEKVMLRQIPRDAIRVEDIGGGDPIDLQFDAVISEQHGQRLTVTDNPIETGVNISDHCFVEGVQIQLVASVSDIRMPNAPNYYASTRGRSNYAYQVLADLQNQLSENLLSPFAVITSVKTYTNMVMTEISMSRDKTTARLGRFTMSFRQIITVDTNTASYVSEPGPKRRSSAPPKDGGKDQAPDPNADQQKAIEKSAADVIFSKGKDALSGIGKLMSGKP
jgi:hypothetical protein